MIQFKSKLGKYFTLGEMLLYRDDNMPNEVELVKMTQLCLNCLDVIRSRFGVVIVTSGYRNEKYNRLAGGVHNSQHRTGEAADIYIKEQDIRSVFKWIVEYMQYDQVIFENKNGKIWIHISYKIDGNRNEALMYDGKNYTKYN